MPGIDWIPGISQIKSGFQLITGDVAGAAETQKNFLQECPVVAQGTSLVQLAAGDSEGALETQKKCLGTVNNVANGLPVVGHVKGAVHHLCGDHEGGNEALNAASRTTVVMGSGAVAALASGGLAAIPAGIAAGGAYDVASTVITEKPQGYLAAYDKVAKDPSAGNIFDAVCVHVGDGLAGYSGGEAATKLANKIEMNQLKQTQADLKVANKGKISTLEAVRDIKQQKLDAGIFPEPKITTGEAISMGKEINALTNEINTLQGNTATLDLKSGNQVSTNVSSTSKGGAFTGGAQNEKERIVEVVATAVKEVSTGVAVGAACVIISSGKTEKKDLFAGNCEGEEEEHDDVEELNIFKNIDDGLDDAFVHDYYENEEAVDAITLGDKIKKLESFYEETGKDKNEKQPSLPSFPFSKLNSLRTKQKQFRRDENNLELNELNVLSGWLHVRMPEEFPFTGAILLNNASHGLYHSVIRHHDQWQDFIPSFQTELQHARFNSLQQFLKAVSKPKISPREARNATKRFLKALNELSETENSNVQSALFDLQLDLYSFIQANVTYENYMGEGVTNSNEVRFFFKVRGRDGLSRVMALGLSSNNEDRGRSGLYAPQNIEFDDDGRPIRTIVTAFIVSKETADEQILSRRYKPEDFGPKSTKP